MRRFTQSLEVIQNKGLSKNKHPFQLCSSARLEIQKTCSFQAASYSNLLFIIGYILYLVIKTKFCHRAAQNTRHLT